MSPDIQEARDWLQGVAERFGTLDLARIRECLHEDVQVHYNLLPPLQGREPVCAFLAPRYAALRDYRLHKTLRFAEGDTLGVEVRFAFTDAASGVRTEGKGFEYLTRRDGRIARWDYVCVTSPIAAPATPSATHPAIHPATATVAAAAAQPEPLTETS